MPSVPFFRGMNGLEYSLFLRAVFPYPTTRRAVLARPEYKAPGLFRDATRTFSRLLTDYWFTCADLRLAQFSARLADTWTYSFRHPLSSPGDARAYGLPEICGRSSACHSGELPFVFGNPLPNFTAEDFAISQRMVSYWGAFVRGEALENWSPSAKMSIVLDDGPSRMAPVPEVCSFWDRVGYIVPVLSPMSPGRSVTV